MEKKIQKRWPGIVVLTCAAVVIIWEAAGLLTRRPGADFTLTANDFADFKLSLPGWRAEQLLVNSNFMEVNLLKYRLQRIAPH